MAQYLGLLNLGNVTNSVGDKEIIWSHRLVTKFSSFKKRGAQLLHSVKYKFDGQFAAEKKIPGDQRADHEEINPPVTRPKRCVCIASKSQSKWRSRINDIRSITCRALGKKPGTSIISQPDIQNVENESMTLSPQTENATIVEELNFLSDSGSNAEGLPGISKVSPNQSRSPSLQAENATAVVIEFNSLSDLDRISGRFSRIAKDSEILPEPEKPDNNATSRTPERRQSLKEERKFSIKSQRTSLPLAAEPMETIAEIETNISSLKIEEINDGVIETLSVIEESKDIRGASVLLKEAVENVEQVQSIVDFEAAIDKEQPLQYETVNISRQEFENMGRDKNVRRIIKIDHKSLPPDAEHLSALPASQSDTHEEWRDIPVPVIDEIRRVTKLKRSHECSRACPCKFSQEMISIYHEAKLLSEIANKIGEDRNHCKFRMTSSEVDFFKGDTKMCNVMIGETQSRRAEMRELMDMWQEANEKLTVRKKEIVNIVESIERTSRRMDEVEHLLKDWLPAGRMEKLRKVQRAIEKEDQERMEMLEDEERTFCKKRVEQIVEKREAWQAEEELREEKRKNQSQKDTLALQNATNLMQKYIDQRKSLLIR